MLQGCKVVSTRLGLIATWVCFAALTAGCVGISRTVTQPTGAELNAPATTEFTTTEVQTTFDVSPLATVFTPSLDCSGVDSVLQQLASSPDPLAQAEQLQLRTKDSKIQVVLTLNEPDPSFLSAYDVEIGSQSELRVQAFVPPAQLCPLARTGKVSAINIPSQAVPQ
jgi:hypothetical protein